MSDGHLEAARIAGDRALAVDDAVAFLLLLLLARLRFDVDASSVDGNLHVFLGHARQVQRDGVGLLGLAHVQCGAARCAVCSWRDWREEAIETVVEKAVETARPVGRIAAGHGNEKHAQLLQLLKPVPAILAPAPMPYRWQRRASFQDAVHAGSAQVANSANAISHARRHCPAAWIEDSRGRQRRHGPQRRAGLLVRRERRGHARAGAPRGGAIAAATARPSMRTTWACPNCARHWPATARLHGAGGRGAHRRHLVGRQRADAGDADAGRRRRRGGGGRAAVAQPDGAGGDHGRARCGASRCGRGAGRGRWTWTTASQRSRRRPRCCWSMRPTTRPAGR